MSDSFFNDVEMGPPIEVFQLTKLFNESQSPEKVNLGVGAYRTDEGKPWVLPVVVSAEMQMANDRTLNHEYLPVSGLPDFRVAAFKLLLGSDSKAITESRVEAFQSLGGTGALRIGAAFLKDVLGYNTVYVSAPTWGNHKGVFKRSGFSDIREYRYWDNDAKQLNITGMLEDIAAAPAKSVIILHGVAHNPTGMDPTKEQWEAIFKVCQESKVFVFMDIAYQGFASGNLEDDAWAVRYFASKDIDMFIAQSFSKNFGLYNERVGCLTVVSKDVKKLPEISSQMEWVIRTMYSNPSNHGARIVATVLNNKAYFEDWKEIIRTMAARIQHVRQDLVQQLKKLGTPGSWDHITKQIGMFSYTGLSVKQVEYLKSKDIFLLNSGRISLCGLNSKNTAHVAKIIDDAVRAHPTLKLDKYAGEPGAGDNVTTFVDLARKKLQETLNVIATAVTIDGLLIAEDDEENDYLSESDNVDFIKVKLQGSMSTLSTPEIKPSVEVNAVDSSSTNVTSPPPNKESKSTCVSYVTLAENISLATEPGTPRSTAKTFSSRGAQTMEEDQLGPRMIPARFQGTMVTPMFFEGIMMTPEKLERLMNAAMNKSEGLSIPVQFKGGMLTAVFKSLAGDGQSATFKDGCWQKENTYQTKVKFEGRLQGMLDPGMTQNGIPIVFDGYGSKTG